MKIEVVLAGDWWHVLIDRVRIAMCKTQADAERVADALRRTP